jgi:hypothetical protein
MDLKTVDHLLTTTRSVRRQLDFSPAESQEDCSQSLWPPNPAAFSCTSQSQIVVMAPVP